MHMRPTLLAGFLLTALGASAQPVMLSDPLNVPGVGMTFPFSKAPWMVVPAGGADVTHDFSALTSTGTGTWEWLPPSAYSNPGAFPNATMALTNGGDTTFYQVTSAGMERQGEKQSLLIYSVEVPLSDPALELQLPLAYGGTWSDDIAGSFTVDANTTGDRIGSIQGVADMYGYIVMPEGLGYFPVLRVTTDLQETNTVHTSLGDVVAFHRRKQSAYYATFLKHPVLRIYSDTLTSILGTQFSAGVEWLDGPALGVDDVAAGSADPTVFPVPAMDRLDLYVGPVPRSRELRVIDATGRVLLHKDLSAGTSRETLWVGELVPGVYQVVVLDPAGARSVTTFVKQ